MVKENMASVLYELSLMEGGVEVSYVALAASMQQWSNISQIVLKKKTCA